MHECIPPLGPAGGEYWRAGDPPSAPWNVTAERAAYEGETWKCPVCAETWIVNATQYGVGPLRSYEFDWHIYGFWARLLDRLAARLN